MESKSIKKFKSALVKEIPFFPNNKETKDDLMNQSISSVMFYYIHWAYRFVPKRPRKVIIENYAINDYRWKNIVTDINDFIAKVKSGEDLTPYLSLLVHSKGYTTGSRIQNGDAERWDDKDFILNIMGFHHFHLEPYIKDKNTERTNNVIFAKITRDEFILVAIFNHDVFDSEKVNNNEMNDERTRLWKIFDEYSSKGIRRGEVYLPSIITMSGHPLRIYHITQEYTHVLNEIDQKLNDKEFLLSFYEEQGLSIPKNNKLNWHFKGLDFGLLDKANSFFVFRYGPI